MNADWLVLIANGAGFIGSFLLAVPFLRENRLKRLLSDLTDAPTGSPEANEIYKRAQGIVERRLRNWKPADYRFAIAGITLLGISYFINIVVWFLTKPSA